jgi:hypothetical protein
MALPFTVISSAAALMAGVGAGRGIAATNASGQRVRVDVAVPSAVAGCLELAVPARRRQPHFDLDVGLSRRLERRRNAAEGREIGELRAATASALRRRKRARGNRLRHGDGRVLQLERRQRLAGLRGDRTCTDEDECGKNREDRFHVYLLSGAIVFRVVRIRRGPVLSLEL